MYKLLNQDRRIILKNNKGKIISATRFMGQKPLQEEDIKDNIRINFLFIIKIKF